MQRRNLLTAILRNAISGAPVIDTENGILRGVKLMELGKVACFSGEDGSPKSVKITPAHIEALLSHAGNRAIPIHETHEWFDAQGEPNADSVEMNARIGALKAFRKDGQGDLIADAYFKEGQKRNDIMWGAANNPEDNCFSVVFSYDKSDPQCIPQNFRAGDIVPAGAATTALFSEANPTPSMDINELVEALKDDKVQAAVAAITKAHKADSAADDEASAKMESDAGVTDADKDSGDDQKPALMRSVARMSRALTRKTKELQTAESALLEKFKVIAKAEATALLGNGEFMRQNSPNPGGDATAKFNAAVKELTDKKVPIHVATQSVIDAQPELYTQMSQALFKPAVAA